MAKVTLYQTTSGTREEVTLEMRVDDVPMAHMVLTASELDGLIAQLWKRRAEMVEEVSREIDPGFRIETIVDPIWRTIGHHPQGLGVALRHPGLGWLGFAFPTEEAKALGKWLLKS